MERQITLTVPEGFEMADIKIQLKPSIDKKKIDIKVRNAKPMPESKPRNKCLYCGRDTDIDMCYGCFIRAQNHFSGKNANCLL